jgi:hypothetical protein
MKTFCFSCFMRNRKNQINSFIDSIDFTKNIFYSNPNKRDLNSVNSTSNIVKFADTKLTNDHEYSYIY